jgi:NADPH:quinone reductase-like Zn-dependent oxidoreductase
MTMVRDRTLFGKVCVKLLRNKFQGAETCVLVGVLLNFVCSTFLATNEVLLLSVQNWTVHGLYWGSYLQHKPEVIQESIQELLEMLGKGTLHVNVSHTFSLDQANQAFAAIQQRQVMGKVMILPGEKLDDMNSTTTGAISKL